MNIITGATGLIGRAAVDALRSAGKPLLTVGRSSSCDLQFDLTTNQQNLTKLIKDAPETIVHCAAAVPNIEEYVDNKTNADKTRTIDRTIFNLANLWQCKIIYLSGCSLYQRFENNYLTESSSLAETFGSPYLTAKKDGDLLFSSYPKAIIARISAPIGPGLSKYSAIGRFIESARINRKIELWGDGTREQDYVDVRDIGNFIVSSIESNNFGPVNVAAGRPVTMLELARMISIYYESCKVVTVPIPDPNLGQYSRYDTKRARLIYNWTPSIQIQQSIFTVIKTC